MAPHRLTNSRIAPELLTRIADASPLGWIVAALASLATAVSQDPFTWALLMLILFSVGDYSVAVRRARDVEVFAPGTYSPAEAARGRRAKITTVLLMLGLRMVEMFAASYGILNVAGILQFLHLDGIAAAPAVQEGGILSAVITALLAFEELASIYGHRVADGGSRIIFAEMAFNGARVAQRFVLGRAADALQGWAGDEAAAAFTRNLDAIQQIDQTSHALANDGEPPPERRHYDVALNEIKDGPGGDPA